MLRISRTCIMRIYVLGRRALVEIKEPLKEVVACCVKVGTSNIVREVEFEWRTGQFLSEEVDLVQEEDLQCVHQQGQSRRREKNLQLVYQRTTVNYILSRRE